MAASTGTKPAEGLPKTLWNMLSILLEENGLRSWQVYSDNQGVSVRMRFYNGENGQVTSGQKVSFSKKTPSQSRRDTKRSQEKRITRQMARNGNGDEVEKPRADNTGDNESGGHALFSPASVDSSTYGQMNDLDPFNCGHSPIPVNNQACNTGVVIQIPDLPDTVDKQSARSKSADHNCDLSQSDEDTTQPGTTVQGITDADAGDSDESDDECDLSLSPDRYKDPRPTALKCSYCGKDYCIYVCAYENCGRKICVYCMCNYRRHCRHQSYFRKR